MPKQTMPVSQFDPEVLAKNPGHHFGRIEHDEPTVIAVPGKIVGPNRANPTAGKLDDRLQP